MKLNDLNINFLNINMSNQKKIIACAFDEDYLLNPNKRECSPSIPSAEPTNNQRFSRFIKSIFYNID